ncbi:hypothetical protein MKX01_008995, partial [Papaver californicum]
NKSLQPFTILTKSTCTSCSIAFIGGYTDRVKVTFSWLIFCSLLLECVSVRQGNTSKTTFKQISQDWQEFSSGMT